MIGRTRDEARLVELDFEPRYRSQSSPQPKYQDDEMRAPLKSQLPQPDRHRHRSAADESMHNQGQQYIKRERRGTYRA